MARLAHLCVYVSVGQEQAEEYAESALKLSRQLNDRSAEALALISLAELEFQHANGKCGPGHVDQALEIARALQDHWLISIALIQKGKFTQLKNSVEGMLLFEEGLREAQLSGDKRIICSGLFWVMINLLATGQFARAKEIARQRISVASEIGDKDAIIFSHNALGSIGLYEEDYLSSEDHAMTVIRLAKSYNHDEGLLHGLGTAGVGSLALKNPPRVLELCGEMERLILAKRIHLKTDIGYHVFLRAWVYMLEDDVEGVRKNAKELLTLYKQDNNTLLAIEYLRVFASLAFMSGCHHEHAVLTSVATRLHERVAVAFFDFPFMNRIREEQLATSHEILGAEGFNKAWEEGQKMTLDTAKEYAMELVNE